MLILGIETSCDETAAAVVENGRNVRSNIIASQINLHNITGGVVPEVAAREHVLKIIPVINQALSEAGIGLEDLDAIAVTQGPGLLSSLVIGVTAATTLAMALQKPLIPVNHIAGHIYANWLEEDSSDPIQFPAAVLTVSGGHNELVLMREHLDFNVLGETLDDAAGEAFDKVARLLGLGYPGGPAIAKIAEKGDPLAIPFPKVYLEKNSYDFSFSGLKTAVLTAVKEEQTRAGALSQTFTQNCAASFQHVVCEVLSDKLLRVAEEYAVKEIHVAGGVSANQYLRQMLTHKLEQGFFHDYKGRRHTLHLKPQLRYSRKLSYCTDNAAMIAGTAYFHYQKRPGKYTNPSAQAFAIPLADPNLGF